MDNLYKLDIFSNYCVSTLRKIVRKLNYEDSNMSRDSILSIFPEEEVEFFDNTEEYLADKFITGVMADYGPKVSEENKVGEISKIYRTRVIFVQSDLDNIITTQFITAKEFAIYEVTTIIAPMEKCIADHNWAFKVLAAVIRGCIDYFETFINIINKDKISRSISNAICLKYFYIFIKVMDDVLDLKYSDYDSMVKCMREFFDIDDENYFKKLYDFIISTNKSDTAAFNYEMRKLLIESAKEYRG